MAWIRTEFITTSVVAGFWSCRLQRTNPNATATSITRIGTGVCRFELRVTDNSGAFGRDAVQITVNPTAANQPPVANAGADQNFDLPDNNTFPEPERVDRCCGLQLDEDFRTSYHQIHYQPS